MTTAQQTFDVQAICDLIQERWESDTPDKVLDALKPFANKPITTRLLAAMPGGKDLWRLRREYGMTHLATWEYIRTQGNAGYCFLLARTESSVPLDLGFFEKENPAYFAGRFERNHARMEARNDKGQLDALAFAMNRVQRALADLQSAVDDLEALTAYGTVFYPDHYEIERAVGLRDAELNRRLNPDYKALHT